MNDPINLPSQDELNHFRDLMSGVQQGSEDAAWELVRLYGGYIRRAVRRILNHKLRAKFDSLDFVQLVWQSFFRRRAKAEQFADPRHFVAYMAAMAGNKVRMEIRNRLTTAKHDVQREVSLNQIPSSIREGIPGREPDPVDVAVGRERWERLLKDQPPHYRRIIELKLQGHTSTNIAAKLNLDAQTVRRFLARLLDTTSP